jgi:hypothetical protein
MIALKRCQLNFSFSYLNKPFLCNDSILLIDSREYLFLLGLLNSNLINFYLKNLTKDKISLNAETIESLKIIYPNSNELTKRIEILVWFLVLFLDILKPYYQKLMYELNNLIYKLYGLNKKEIEIIEKERGG